MTKNKKWIGTVILLLVLLCGWMAWSKWASTTRIGLVNFQNFQTTSLIKSNEDQFIKYEEVPLEELGRLDRYDFVLGFGMGLRMTAGQREQLQKAADKGTPVYIYAATNPENNICNLDSITKADITSYIGNGNKKNYRNMARYIRRQIDRKLFFVTPADTAVESASDVLFHLDENLSFSTVTDYENYIKGHGFYREGQPKVAIVGGLNDPFSGNRDNIDSLIVSFQRAGLNVYPISSYMKRLAFLKEIQPDAVIHFAHGRMVMGQADAAVEWLKERNIPLFSPLSILQTREEWEKDPMGMFGGFMSQSVVVPELDGAIYPYVVNDQELDKDGVYLFKAIPERLKNFTGIVSHFIRLKQKANADKRVAIYYFKGAGQSSLTAQGLETVPSLYNLIKRLKAEGYKVENLPATEKEFEKLLMTQGAVLSTYAEGAFDDFMKNGHPALVEKSEYESWVKQALPQGLYADVVKIYGEAPGNYMSTVENGKSYLAVARIDLGNVVLLPQPMAAVGDDAFAIVHGAKTAPPHTYIGAYLWARYAFGADAMIHFGTHGSLEFTPQKQVALSSYDWPDRLVGTVPHFYYYTIGNVGESMMAKRRSYATTISYLTPPFMESKTRGQYKKLENEIQTYYKTDESGQLQASLAVKKIAVEMGLHRELRLDSLLDRPYSTEEIERIENFAEELATEKITGQLYTMGVPYEDARIKSSVYAMATEPIAYSLLALDKLRKRADEKTVKHRALFTQHYLNPARTLVTRLLANPALGTDELICRVADITPDELAKARKMEKSRNAPQGMMAMMMAVGGGEKAPMKKMPSSVEYTKEEITFALAVMEVERTIKNVGEYKKALIESPEKELLSMTNALNGGYTQPSPGGDPIVNPNTLPTGRNLYGINAEATPSEAAWEKGIQLANNTIEMYKRRHNDSIPRKVSYTLWSGEFIETEGATIAQILYMLGVEPLRDAFGRVTDLKLIPSKELGRPRIDVVVQTSGQLRDIAASRLFLINRAVEMAAHAKDDQYENQVAAGVVDAERVLIEKGLTPKDAREVSTFRVFGGMNGGYGTDIQSMVMSGDRWESEKEIADTYLNNMGAYYGSEKNWEAFRKYAFEAALTRTDVVVQPRQSNTWGALSLDHVYEFMGGMNLAVRNVTGKDPDAYLSDYRNRNHMRMQEVKEAVGVESRTTILNPAYIKEKMKGGSSSAAEFAETVTNTYGWNVMKPAAIDKELWDNIYNVYVKDEYNLNVKEFFETQSPAALEEMTAIMLESARKGLWKASAEQVAELAKLHTETVNKYRPSCSGFVCDNAKLREYIASKSDAPAAAQYKENISKIREAKVSGDAKGMVMKKEEINRTPEEQKTTLSNIAVGAAVVVVILALVLFVRKRRKTSE